MFRFLKTTLVGGVLTLLPIAMMFASVDTLADDQLVHVNDGPTSVAPVILDGELLFQLRGVSALPATERAAAVRERIIALARNAPIAPDSGKVDVYEDRVAVVYGDQTVVIFYLVDAEIEAVPLKLVADAALNRIASAIKDYRQSRSTANLLQSTGYLIAISIAAALLFWAVLALFKGLNTLVERRVKRRIKKLEQASHRVLDAAQIGGWLRGLLALLRTILLFALVMVWLNAALGLYPWTRPMAAQLFSLVLGPIKEMVLGVLTSVPDLAFLTVLFFVIQFILRAIRTFFDRVHRGWIRLTRFEAELLVIDGLYRTADDSEATLRGEPIEAHLEGEAMIITKLD